MKIFEGKPTKDGRKYYCRIRYKDSLGNYKEHRTQMYATKKEVKDAELEFINSLKEPKGNTTFEILMNSYLNDLKTKIKPTSFAKAENECKYFKPILNIKIQDLNVHHINTLKNNLKGCVSYKNKILGRFTSIINYGNKYYDTPTSCLKYIDKFVDLGFKKEMDFYTFEEYIKFSSVIDDSIWKLFFDMFYYMGFRKGELQALTWKNVDLNKEELTIKQSLTTKLKGIEYVILTPKTKNSIRVLPIPKKLVECLKMLKLECVNYTDFSNDWFVFGNTIPFKDTSIEVHKNNYAKMSGLRQIRIHDFRHSCASFLINKGASIQLVSKYLGHSSIDITLKTYTHLYKNELSNIKIILDDII